MTAAELYGDLAAMKFADPLWFFLLLALPLLFFFKKKGYLGFSDHRLLSAGPIWLRVVAKFPMGCLVGSMIMLTLALASPQIPGPPIHKTIPGRDVELVVDIS